MQLAAEAAMSRTLLFPRRGGRKLSAFAVRGVAYFVNTTLCCRPSLPVVNVFSRVLMLSRKTLRARTCPV